MNDNKPIRYNSSGLLGDFIHQLSIVNEIYIKTGKKGIIYVSEKYDRFRGGLEFTYSFTHDIIKSQEYVEDYKMYNGEEYDIDLACWRNNPLLYKTTFYKLFVDTFNIDWCKHKILNLPYNEKWSNKVLINFTDYRYNNSFDFDHLYSIYGNNLVFISIHKEHYNFFQKTFNRDIEYYCPTSFLDLCIAVSSCKMCVAGGSAILALAFACHKKTIILKIDNHVQLIDNVFFNKIENDLPFCISQDNWKENITLT